MKYFADAHCDLLSYLQTVANASPLADESRCSLPLLEQGQVGLQTMAIFTLTKRGSTKMGIGQVEKFMQLLKNYPKRVYMPSNFDRFVDYPSNDRTIIIPAIENASGFCEEDEPLSNGLTRLDQMEQQLGYIFYISLTHHTENRFGGGNYTNIGLKDDGKRLLDHLASKKIAVDFSHTSDALAYGILEHIDKYKLPIRILASHSNFRAVHNHPRNLPEDLAMQIARRGGFVGLTWLKDYIGNSSEDFFRHWEYGAQKQIPMASGADLFYYLPNQFPKGVYFDRYSNASHYSLLIEDMEARHIATQSLRQFSYVNLWNFLHSLWSGSKD
ncbi:dipeptidase [Rhodoflexus sp.]